VNWLGKYERVVLYHRADLMMSKMYQLEAVLKDGGKVNYTFHLDDMAMVEKVLERAVPIL
jgi:hypothetical protein